MKYTIAAHPTEYKKTKFRSRLEARWAAFFDLIDWEWEYEPLDLKGWVPDFVIHGADQKPLFVEVKPIFIKDPEKIEQDILTKIIAALDKPTEALLVGADLIYPTEGHEALGVGVLAEDGWWQHASFCHGGIADGIGVVPAWGSFHSRISRSRGGDSGSPAVLMPYRGEMRDCDRETQQMYHFVKNAWAEAGNITRWRPR